MRCCLLLAGLSMAVMSGCSKKEDPRAPRIEECMGEGCDVGNGVGGGVPPISSIPDSTPSNTPDDDGGSQGTQGTLEGDVTMLTNTDLRTARPLESEVEISALASAGGRVTTRYDGDMDFSLDGVQITGNLWVGVEQVGTPQVPLMRTLQAINSTKTDLLHLYVVERASLEDIAGQSALQTPVDLDATKGHVLIYFVDGNDEPVRGVSILDNTAIDGALVAYDAGDLYSDGLEETDIGGSALLLNLEANSFPGDAKTIAFSHDGLDSSFVVDVARDSITMVAVGLN
jgi:hypothetical protein